MLQLPCVSPQLGLQTVSSPRCPPRSSGCFDPWPSAKWSRCSTAARCFTATVWTADFLLTGRMGPLIYTPTVSLSVSLLVIQQMFAHILQHSHTWTHQISPRFTKHNNFCPAFKLTFCFSEDFCCVGYYSWHVHWLTYDECLEVITLHHHHHHHHIRP